MQKIVSVFTVIIIAGLFGVAAVSAESDKYAGQTELTKKDVEYISYVMELEKEYSETMLPTEDYLNRREKLFQKAGWDDLRFEFVLIKVISTAIIVKKPDSAERVKRRLQEEDGASMVPNEKEIALVRKNINRISGWLNMSY